MADDLLARIDAALDPLCPKCGHQTTTEALTLYGHCLDHGMAVQQKYAPRVAVWAASGVVQPPPVPSRTVTMTFEVMVEPFVDAMRSFVGAVSRALAALEGLELPDRYLHPKRRKAHQLYRQRRLARSRRNR